MRNVPVQMAFAAVLFCAADTIHAALVDFAPGRDVPGSRFRITPSEPTTATLITFFDPYNRLTASNACVARQFYGEPSLLIDAEARTIDLVFSAPRPGFCPSVVDPVSGVRGDFGLLPAGDWTYRSLETHTFTVRAVPEPAGLVGGAAFGATLLLRRRR